MNQIKLTPAQQWLVHALETLFMGAIVSGGIDAYQAVASGNYNWQAVGGLVVAAVFAVLSKGWSSNIQNNANLLPALMDTVQELKNLVLQQPAATSAGAPLVVVHTAQQPMQATEVQPASPSLARVVPQRPAVPQALPAMTPHTIAQLDTSKNTVVPAEVQFQRDWSGVVPAIQPGK